MDSREQFRAFFRARVIAHVAAFIFVLIGCSLFPANAVRAQTSANAQQTDNATGQKSARGKSIVRGRVVYDDTERPLRRVRVTIYDPNEGENHRARMATTDRNGEFVLRSVAAGKYRVIVDVPGIIRPDQFNSEDEQEDIVTVSVDGTSSAEVKVRARRGASLTGKVTYADGDPAVNALIRVLRKKGGRFVPVYVSGMCGGQLQADERGVYRLTGLPPGEYIVGAGEQMIREIDPEDTEKGQIESAVLSGTYYAGAINARNATPVRVDAASETNDINITLIERPSHKLAGTLIAQGTGRPVVQASISLQSRDEAGFRRDVFENQSASPDKQGRWSFDEVPDGNYTIIVTPNVNFERDSVVQPESFVIKRQDVTLAGIDVTNLTIEISKGGRVSGTVMVEGGRPLPPNITIYPETAVGERRIQLSSAIRVQPDGSFSIEGLPTDGVWIRAIAPDGKYYTKSATANGVDLMREPLIVSEGGEATGVRLIISPEVATMTGRVLTREGSAPVRRALVMLIPADPDKLRLQSARLQALTDEGGRFSLTGAPGEYRVFVLQTDSEMYRLDETIKARMAEAQRITLQPNERKNMDIVAPASK